MAVYKLGDRVRVLSVGSDTKFAYVIGKEGVVNEVGCTNQWGQRNQIGVTIDGDSCFCFEADMLAPLTPPPLLIAWEDCVVDRDGRYRQGVSA